MLIAEPRIKCTEVRLRCAFSRYPHLNRTCNVFFWAGKVVAVLAGKVVTVLAGKVGMGRCLRNTVSMASELDA